jgi:uncharacterized membrane protein YgcG
MGGLQQDLLAVRRSADAAADAATSASEKEPAVDGAQVAGNPSAQSAAAGAVDPKTSQAAQELEALLSTDAGRTVFEGAMRRVEQKRDEERSARMVTGLVDAFAQRANLTPEQSEQMKKVVGKTFTEIGALWRTSGEGEMTPEQRAQKRQEVFAKAEEIRKTTEEEVKTILNVEQFEMFQQESARMRGFIDGGAGGFGGRGGRGGFGAPGGQGGAGGGGRGQ